ncbi:hypothetical protein J5N97_021948 [Dioscorea zingiberensis]|uniref:Uncharacterized protein n=1 Tax=Dioscorea zingiberensis TaxID=325984 RepID=A0A9D5C9P2_9LILI|nr:hypothetical protein J5N97_021948 [Dioscorea zingiberensis]
MEGKSEEERRWSKGRWRGETSAGGEPVERGRGRSRDRGGDEGESVGKVGVGGGSRGWGPSLSASELDKLGDSCGVGEGLAEMADEEVGVEGSTGRRARAKVMTESDLSRELMSSVYGVEGLPEEKGRRGRLGPPSTLPIWNPSNALLRRRTNNLFARSTPPGHLLPLLVSPHIAPSGNAQRSPPKPEP